MIATKDRSVTSWQVALLCLVLMGATLAVYGPTVKYSFIDFDDGVYVFDNPRIATGFASDNVASAFKTVCAGNWHPLTMLSLMMGCQLFGVQPGPQHLINAVLHAANTGLLFFVLLRMTIKPWRSAIVAGLFGLHPVHVESVAWIAERKDVLSGFFFMLTLGSYVRFAQARSEPATAKAGGREKQSVTDTCQAILWYALAGVFLTFGLMSKPMLVSTPFLFLLVDYWPLHRMLRTKDLGFLLLEKLPLLGLALASSAVTLWAQGSSGSVLSLASLPLLQRLANASSAYVFYLGKLFWPQGLMIPYLPEANANPAWPWCCAIGLAFVTILLLWPLRRWKYLAFGWLWFVIALVPVIGIVQAGIQVAADRYTYLPSIGLFIAVVWGLADLSAMVRVPGLIIAMALVLILGANAFLTSRQIACWQNSETLFLHTLKIDPTNMIALNSLAWAYATDPDPSLRKGAQALRIAEACAQQTERREPVFLMTLAAAYAEVGQFESATQTAREGLRLVANGPATTFANDLSADLELFQSGKAIPERYYLGQAKRQIRP